MKTILFYTRHCIIVLLLIGCQVNAGVDTHPYEDPLPSWNEGPLKQSILAYIRKVTDSTSKDYIPSIDRIAIFDNDGTLWAEQPLIQKLFVFYMVRKMVARTDGLSKKQPFKAVIENDKNYFIDGGDKAIIEILSATHTGMTEDEFESAVREFFSSFIYPSRNTPVNKVVYKPQLELLNYLRANGFTTFICSGGTVEFIRGISQQLYGIPKHQVIGTTFKYKFIDSTRTVLREPTINQINDKEGKPVSIQRHIGQRPVFACGNEGGEGDIAMLKFCQSSKYPSFQLLINHDDAEREFSYKEKSNASLNQAAKNKWHVVSMKNDWKNIFPD